MIGVSTLTPIFSPTAVIFQIKAQSQGPCRACLERERFRTCRIQPKSFLSASNERRSPLSREPRDYPWDAHFQSPPLSQIRTRKFWERVRIQRSLKKSSRNLTLFKGLILRKANFCSARIGWLFLDLLDLFYCLGNYKNCINLAF